MKKALYYPKWFVENHIEEKTKPLQSIVFITNRCNLECKNCQVSRQPGTAGFYELKFQEVIEIFEKCYAMGSRVLDIDGGEPLLWRDGDYTCNDLVRRAKEMGFVRITIKTNGRRPLESNADALWIGIDGTPEQHDRIRGKGNFERIVENIASSNFHNLNCNMVINKINYKNYKDVIAWVKDTRKLQNIAFNFLAPQNGLHHLKLDKTTRDQIIDELIELKKQKYPIFNSIAGLKRMKDDNFEKYCWVNTTMQEDGTYVSECAGKKEGLCKDCGHSMKAESAFSAKHLRPI